MQADELRIQLLDLSASIMGDINLCGTSSLRHRGQHLRVSYQELRSRLASP
jgi:hypothetical protein